MINIKMIKILIYYFLLWVILHKMIGSNIKIMYNKNIYRYKKIWIIQNINVNNIY